MSFNDTYALPYEEIILPLLPPAMEEGKKLSLSLILLLASFPPVLFYTLWPKRKLGQKKNGLSIPKGPRGLPILGLSSISNFARAASRFDTTEKLTQTHRLLPLPNALPGTHSRPLGPEVRRPVLRLAREPALRHRLGPRYSQGSHGH